MDTYLLCIAKSHDLICLGFGAWVLVLYYGEALPKGALMLYWGLGDVRVEWRVRAMIVNLSSAAPAVVRCKLVPMRTVELDIAIRGTSAPSSSVNANA